MGRPETPATSEPRPSPSGRDEREEDEQVTQGMPLAARVSQLYLPLILGPKCQAAARPTILFSKFQAIEWLVLSVVQQLKEPGATLFTR